MKKSIVKVACAVLILLMVAVGASACTSTTVDQITEGALRAINDGDYETYLGYFVPEDRSLLTEGEFDEVCQTLKDIVGDYISKEFLEMGEASGYIIVTYTADFSDEPEGVTVAFYFEDTGTSPHYLLQRIGWENIYHEDLYIAGLWFDSPKIQDYLNQ